MSDIVEVLKSLGSLTPTRDPIDSTTDFTTTVTCGVLIRAAAEIERLRRAAATAADIIDKHLNTQREKVTDAAAILRDALQPR